jgi:hypothetical protein
MTAIAHECFSYPMSQRWLKEPERSMVENLPRSERSACKKRNEQQKKKRLWPKPRPKHNIMQLGYVRNYYCK